MAVKVCNESKLVLADDAAPETELKLLLSSVKEEKVGENMMLTGDEGSTEDSATDEETTCTEELKLL